MLVFVRIKGTSAGIPWKYTDYSYSCVEYDRKLASCSGLGEYFTCTSSDSMSTNILFIALFITKDIKQHFLSSLEKELNAKYSTEIPTLQQLNDLSRPIKKCLIPSLKTLCFTFFQSNKLDSKIIKNSEVPIDLQQHYQEFQVAHRPDERW